MRSRRSIAFDVGQKYRNPCGGKPFGQDLQRDGFACACGPRDQSMTVGIADVEKLFRRVVFATAADEDIICHVFNSFWANNLQPKCRASIQT